MELIDNEKLKKTINKELRNIQNQENDKIYKDKNKSDKIICIVCDGKYTRSQRCTHLSTKKHKKGLEEIYKNYNII